MGIQEIEAAITKLPIKRLIELATWLEEYQARTWDQQIEADLTMGRLGRSDYGTPGYYSGRSGC
jgi:hypothetical protein